MDCLLSQCSRYMLLPCSKPMTMMSQPGALSLWLDGETRRETQICHSKDSAE